MTEKDFWYIGCESKDLKIDRPKSVTLFDEWIVLFRDQDGRPVALKDRCTHRSAQLSMGKVRAGCIECPYHGWTYDKSGNVVRIPSEGPDCNKSGHRSVKAYQCIEKEGYIYLNLSETTDGNTHPFSIPDIGKPGFQHIRLLNFFENNVTNCVENFVDIPHTVFVHPGIFRKVENRKLTAQVRRANGEVHAEYFNEAANLGYFSKFLNPGGHIIRHVDSFYAPNITSVRYEVGPTRIFNITSQSIPLSATKTMVYTDLTYNYGIWSWLARPIVRQQAQKIIDQDIVILANQMKTIQKYGQQFMNSPADVIHIYIESIRGEIEKGNDPRKLPEKVAEVDFWV